MMKSLLLLLCAAHRLDPLDCALMLQVFEQRPAPRDKYGGSCRLEPNGLNAVEALGKGLLRDVVAHATLSKTILMHDTEGDCTAVLAVRGFMCHVGSGCIHACALPCCASRY